PLLLSEIILGSDLSTNCHDLCNAYRVLVPTSGHTEAVHKGASVRADPGSAAVYSPEGLSTTRWTAGSTMIWLKIDRAAVVDALGDALGRQVTSPIDFTPVMPTATVLTRSWLRMLAVFTEQFFQPDSIVNRQIVGLAFADSVVRGLLLAADHSYRDALANGQQAAAPRPIRAAVEVIEEDAHLPLTLSSIAARCHVSVRALQRG